MQLSRETVERIIDDLETKAEQSDEKGERCKSDRIKFYAYGKGNGLEYAAQQLRQALQDG